MVTRMIKLVGFLQLPSNNGFIVSTRTNLKTKTIRPSIKQIYEKYLCTLFEYLL